MMSQLIDALILLLLAGTLAYAFLVDRRVRGLIAMLHELQPIVGQFSAAVDRSENSVNALRDVAEGLADDAARPAPAAERAKKDDARPGVTRVTGKGDLVRGFFEATRGRGA